MSKRQLYFLVLVLFIALLYVLFRPVSQSVPETPNTNQATSSDTVNVANEKVEPVVTTTTTETVFSGETVTIEGVFVGLTEDSGLAFTDTFEYLLLDDGTEIILIDLRPLIGYEKTDVPAKLGVERGERVKVTGHLDADSQFVIEAISPIQS